MVDAVETGYPALGAGTEAIAGAGAVSAEAVAGSSRLRKVG
jgi:hypothetical protein